jgi:hypothetical protein
MVFHDYVGIWRAPRDVNRMRHGSSWRSSQRSPSLEIWVMVRDEVTNRAIVASC